MVERKVLQYDKKLFFCNVEISKLARLWMRSCHAFALVVIPELHLRALL